jgi:hypothetical protein
LVAGIAGACAHMNSGVAAATRRTLLTFENIRLLAPVK